MSETQKESEGRNVLKDFFKTFQEIIYVERFSTSAGVLQRIDPRVKLLCITAFILSAIVVRTIFSLIVLLIVTFALCLLSRIPLGFFFKRTTVFIPIFAGIIALPLPFITPGTSLAIVGLNGLTVEITKEGVTRAVQFTLRVWVCIASMILMVLTTRFSKLMQTMANLRLPQVLVTMTTVTYRFIFLFINEAYRMALARESRIVAGQRWREHVKSLGNMVATLFIRAHERGERVYLAMIARGYTGTIGSLGRTKCVRGDWVFAGASLLTCLMVVSAEYLHLGGW